MKVEFSKGLCHHLKATLGTRQLPILRPCQLLEFPRQLRAVLAIIMPVGRLLHLGGRLHQL